MGVKGLTTCLPHPLFFFPLPFTPFLPLGAGGGAMEADNAKAICVSSSRSLKTKTKK